MRNLLLSIVASGAIAAASTASATSFVGSTTGCFGPAVSCPTGSSPATILGTPVGGGTAATLQFTTGNFNVTDSGGIAPIGSGNPPDDTLGFFSFTGGTGTSTFDTPFTLFVTFSMPTGTGTGGTFMSAITGSVTDGTQGGVDIDFDESPHLFLSDEGPFTLRLHSLSLTDGDDNVPITGTIRTLAVPEPATWAMMMLGFGGIGFAMRFRRRPIAQVA